MKSFEDFKKACRYKIKDLCAKYNIPCSYNNCQLNPPKPLSFGESKNKNKDVSKEIGNLIEGGKKTLITPKQLEAYKLRKQGFKFKFIADKMGISIKQAHKHYSNFLRKTNVLMEGGKNNGGGVKKPNTKNFKIRLHNDEIKIKIVNDLSKLPGRLIQWHKNCSYKLCVQNDVELRFFRKTTVIKFKEDIIAKTEEKAEIKANNRIKEFLVQTYGLNQYIQLKRHYGLLGTGLAKYTRKKGMEIIIYEDHEPIVRQRLDFSKKKYEIDSESVKFGRTDSEKTRDFQESIIKRPHYLPHETKAIVDTILGVQKEYAYQIRKHLEVQDETLKTLKAIQESFKK